MKKLLILLFLFVSLNAADEKKIYSYTTLSDAIVNYEKQVVINQNNVYFYNDDKGYHVMYDPKASMESEYSFLQIFNSNKFEDVIAEYRRTSQKKNLYIKKFLDLYFLRLSNKDIKYTQKMFLELEGRFPKIYHSQIPKKNKNELKDLSASKVVFLDNRLNMQTTDPVNEIVISRKKEDIVPNLKNDYNIPVNKITRQSNIEVINDIENAVSNFGIARGDVLGLKNLGLYDLGLFNNYGILCKTSDSVLYLVSREEIKSIYDFRGKNISTGKVTDIAQIYLKNALKDTGILKDIDFKALSIDASIKALEDKEIDVFFLFAPKNHIYKFLKKGFYISSIPNMLRTELNTQEGLSVVKYKIDDRLILTYQSPNFLVSPLATLDVDIVKKIEIVANRYGCFNTLKIPKAFFGQVHPELLKALELLKAKLEAEKQAKLDADALALEKDGVSISYVETKKYDEYVDYIYKVSNITTEPRKVIFQYIKTKYFDQFAIKPHHVLTLNTKSEQLSIEPNSEKIISFRYKNPFTIRIENLKVELVFKDAKFTDKRIILPLTIGDNL